MSDFLSRVAARALGAAPGLAPRAPSMFEGPGVFSTEAPAPGPSMPELEVAWEVEPGRLPRETETRPFSARHPDAPMPGQVDLPAPTEYEAAPVDRTASMAARPRLAVQPNTAFSLREPAALRRDRTPLMGHEPVESYVHAAAALPERDAEQAISSSAPRSVERGTPLGPSDRERTRSTAVAARVQRETVAAAPRVSTRAAHAAAVHAESARDAAGAGARNPGSTSKSASAFATRGVDVEPTVNISIGRIEVRATTPAAAPAPRANGTHVMPLEMYLRQRSPRREP
ncbi:hypothetical protein LVJ94_24805 [Pendulispora rubella]|uniref:Uncharacterized protein n=1 Tax=Pendulispora rubella TaxID=2741070 RepID=A0ABZ2LJ68_9BACT